MQDKDVVVSPHQAAVRAALTQVAGMAVVVAVFVVLRSAVLAPIALGAALVCAYTTMSVVITHWKTRPETYALHIGVPHSLGLVLLSQARQPATAAVLAVLVFVITTAGCAWSAHVATRDRSWKPQLSGSEDLT